MKRMKAYFNICIPAILMILLISACSFASEQTEPPELLRPLSNVSNTAVATVGTLERIAQYPGIIRVKSDQLNFGNTHLRFNGFSVMTGDTVKEGQVLATLDTENIEKQLETLLEDYEFIKQTFEFENNILNLELSILQTEYDELIFRHMRFNDILAMESLIESKQLELKRLQDRDIDEYKQYLLQTEINNLLAEYDKIVAGHLKAQVIRAKRFDIELKKLAQRQLYERHTLSMRDMEFRINNVNEQLEKAMIKAPYDGVITWLATVGYRDYLYPFQIIICISDFKDIFIEYASTDGITFREDDYKTVAYIGDNVYELERRILDDTEMSFFVVNRMVPPARFNFVDPDHGVKPGAPVVIRRYLDRIYDTLMIPTNTVYTLQAERYVYLNNNGSKEMRFIETGLRNRAFIQVLSGLEEGDEVFVR